MGGLRGGKRRVEEERIVMGGEGGIGTRGLEEAVMVGEVRDEFSVGINVVEGTLLCSSIVFGVCTRLFFRILFFCLGNFVEALVFFLFLPAWWLTCPTCASMHTKVKADSM